MVFRAGVGQWRKKLMHRPTEGEKASWRGSVEKETIAQTPGKRKSKLLWVSGEGS